MKAMLLALFLLRPAAARAAESPPAAEPAAKTAPSKGLKACRRDIRRFCAKIDPGDGRLARCLTARWEELSRSCRKFAGHGGREHAFDSLRELDLELEKAREPRGSR